MGSPGTLKRRRRFAEGMGSRHITESFVRAEITDACKASVFFQQAYETLSFEAVSAVYSAARDALQTTVDDFVDAQDAALGISSSRNTHVEPSVSSFEDLTREEYDLRVAGDRAYLKGLNDAWQTQGFNEYSKPEWPTSDEPNCDERGADRTVYDHNRRLLVPDLNAAAERLTARLTELAEDMDELAALTPDLRKRLAEGFFTSYESRLRSSSSAGSYRVDD